MASESTSHKDLGERAKSSDNNGEKRSVEPKKHPKYTDQIEQVKLAEAELIRERRQHPLAISSGKPDDGPLPPDLVGLALSGGGIRAASVGLGALQALYRDGGFREIDYLSTVSGGGYIGGYLSSAAVGSETTVHDALAMEGSGKDHSPAAAANGQIPRSDTLAQRPADTDYGQPSLVQRFIFGGKYLLRPWEAANKYLIGLFFANLVLVSGLVMVAALIAFAWRSLDYNVVRDFLELFYLNSSTYTAFFAFDFFLACWVIAWLISYFKHEADAPGKWAQRWLYFMAASFFIGIAVLLGNPATDVGFLAILTGKDDNSGVVTKLFLGVLGAGLSPFLVPRVILRMGLNPQNVWERAIFRVAAFALLVGVPLLLIGVLARQNISDTAKDPENNRAGDVSSWPSFLALMNESSASQQRAKIENDELSKDYLSMNGNDQENPVNIARANLRKSTKHIEALMQRRSDAQIRLEAHAGVWDRFVYLLGWPTMVEVENPLHRYWDVNRQVVAAQDVFCRDFSKYVLISKQLPAAIVEGDLLEVEPRKPSQDVLPPKESDGTIAVLLKGFRDAFAVAQPTSTNVFQQIRAKLLDEQDKKLKNAEMSDNLVDAERSYKFWSPQYVKELNLKLLRAMHPECFFDAQYVYRDLVVVHDQNWRAIVFAVALAIFVVAAALVNMNSTSLHRFYRNRLKFAYLVPHKEGQPDFQLSDLNTTAGGAPYHLINATLNLSRPRFLDEVDAECQDLQKDRRDVQTFIFSKSYCGSDATGWASTEHYQTFRDDNINVADAIALSGSAIDPLRGNSLGLMAAMSALNLSLGQWMPNPRFEKPWMKPNFFVLLKDWLRWPVEESTYCYVSDGGFTDNLGIMSLLRRRCRLIIALDASCDADRAYVDLNWVIRMARIRYGIKILEINEPNESDEVLNTSCLDPDEKGNCKRHFALARVVYPDRQEDAWLVYLKPSFTGDEGADLLKYRVEAPAFPNDDTSDQFYEPPRVEAYRQMGFHITADFCQQLKDCIAASTTAAKKATSEADAPAPEAKTMLDTMKLLKDSLVEKRAKEKAHEKEQEELPRVAHDAMRVGKSIAETLQAQADRREQKQTKVDREYQSGGICPQSGRWISSGCRHENMRDMAAGEKFPRCYKCRPRPVVTWRFEVPQ